MELAFERANVTLDLAGFSGETLFGALHEPLDKVRAGRYTPETIRIRLLLSDMTRPMALPCRAEDRSDDPAVRDRSARITDRSVQAITDAVRELGELGLVKTATVEVRVHGAPPLFKLYLINDEEAFFGFYPVSEHTVTIKGEPVAIYDAMGKDAVLFPFAVSDDETSTGGLYVAQARQWFDSVWSTVSYQYES